MFQTTNEFGMGSLETKMGIDPTKMAITNKQIGDLTLTNKKTLSNQQNVVNLLGKMKHDETPPNSSRLLTQKSQDARAEVGILTVLRMPMVKFGFYWIQHCFE